MNEKLDVASAIGFGGAVDEIPALSEGIIDLWCIHTRSIFIMHQYAFRSGAHPSEYLSSCVSLRSAVSCEELVVATSGSPFDSSGLMGSARASRTIAEEDGVET